MSIKLSYLPLLLLTLTGCANTAQAYPLNEDTVSANVPVLHGVIIDIKDVRVKGQLVDAHVDGPRPQQYVVSTTAGQTVSVVKHSPDLHLGDKVAVIYGQRSNISLEGRERL